MNGRETGFAPQASAPATGPATQPVVSVLYFAALRDLARTSEEQVRLEEAPMRVARFLSTLEARHTELKGRLQAVRVAVNEEFVALDAQLSGGEVVALIPPVSGG